MKNRNRIRRLAGIRRAFTLLEVMLVLVIIAAIAGIAVMNVGGIRTKAFGRTAAAQVSGLKNYLEQYKLELGSYPSTLDALYTIPSDADPQKWVQLLREPLSADPWGSPYEYRVNGDSYELRSLGVDKQSGTEDDIPPPGK